MEERADGAADASANEVELWRALGSLYAYLSPQRRRQFFLLLALMLLGACAELASIGAVVPLLALLADPSGLHHFPWAAQIFDWLGGGSAAERLAIATLIFSLLVIAAGIVRLQLAWYTQDFIFRVGHDVSVEIHRRLLFQPYSFHINRHTITLVAAIQKTEVLVFNLLLPVMQAAIAAFIALFIIATLIFIDPGVAIGVAAAFSAIYLLVSSFTRGRLRANSTEVGTAWDERLKVVQESLEGIRDVILDNAQALYLRMFDRANLRLSLSRADTAFLSNAPRFVIETIGMVIIAVVALIIARRGEGLAVALPVVGALALGAQRLLPLLQQIYSAWSNAAGNRSVLVQVIDLLKLPAATDADLTPVEALPLEREIRLEQVSFTYATRRRPAVEGVFFAIPAKSSVALIGETGSGKSTLADIIMGLLDPDSGRVLIDGAPLGRENRRRWQQSIAHVPQSIFLADSTIARNIALSLPDVAADRDRIVASATKAQLHDFVASLPAGYETLVGERGVRLSGGQRQRLGLARAIYKGAPVMVLDEATSALDDATEAAVMRALEELRSEGRTIIIVAHRLSTIRHCDLIARLDGGRLIQFGRSGQVLADQAYRG